LAAISTYLWAVHDEATRRRYTFDSTKIAGSRQPVSLNMTEGQLRFEYQHLKEKLRRRDPEWLRGMQRSQQITPHPLFVVVAGDIEPWERGR
jgi:hypothetical protein